RISCSLMNAQMIRVISSPSSSTIGFSTSIFAIPTQGFSYEELLAPKQAGAVPEISGRWRCYRRGPGGRVGEDAVRAHADSAEMPADEVRPIADTVIIRPDPERVPS